MLSLKQGQDHIKTVLHRQDTKLDSIASAIIELKDIVEKQLKTSFCLKAANLEVRNLSLHSATFELLFMQLPLRKEMAKLFCQTLDRYPKQEDVNVSCI